MQSYYLTIYFLILAVKIGKYAFCNMHYFDLCMFQYAGKRVHMNTYSKAHYDINIRSAHV